MRRSFCVSLIVLTTVAATPLAAKGKRPVKVRASTVVAKAAPAPVIVPVSGGVMIPRAVVMRPMTPREAEANAIWNLRAGLNVAALQCSFSPYLRTTRIYNDVLKDHDGELDVAMTTLQAHFRRYDGAKSANTFDQYVTRTYNSYSTLDAQYAFCDAAALIGRGALAIPKGDFGRFALAMVPVLRSSLTPVPLSATLRLIDAQAVAVPTF